MSRPKLEPENRLSKRYLVRVSPKQEAEIKAKLRAQGGTCKGVATFIRNGVLNNLQAVSYTTKRRVPP